MSREIASIDQIDEALAESIRDHAVSWLGAPGDRDWEDYVGRVERHLDLCLPETMDHPVIRRVKRLAVAGWNEANEE